MLRFLTLALVAFSLVNGAVLSYKGKDDVNKNRRFTFEDGNYEISSIRTDWYSARNQCKLQGGKLMSIESRAEMGAILGALSNTIYLFESIWTSGSDIDKEGLFYWDTTGASVDSFTLWGSGHPVANDTAHCIELNSDMDHKWADASCDLDRFFVCEFHPCSRERDVLSQSAQLEKADHLLTFTYKNGTYVVPNDKAIWVDAKSRCKLMGMELVSIETLEEDFAISDGILPLATLNIWTSGTNAGQMGNYYWEGSGHAVKNIGWYPGQPNYEDVFNCIQLEPMYGQMWSDYWCDGEFNYICELQPCTV